jgi:hypothetical protein
MSEPLSTAHIDHQVKHVAIVVIAISVVAATGFILMGRVSLLGDATVGYAVAMVGTLGGTANNYRKLQRLTGVSDDVLRDVPRSLVTSRIYLSPIIGGVFALVAYLLFMGGVLSGGLFPEFACSADGFASYSKFAECSPTTNADVALAMVWGFVAGFAENFVPNILDKLAAGQDPNSTDDQAATDAPPPEGS